MLECLMLRDRLNLLGECDSVVSRLGFVSATEFTKWQARLSAVARFWRDAALVRTTAGPIARASSPR